MENAARKVSVLECSSSRVRETLVTKSNALIRGCEVVAKGTNAKSDGMPEFLSADVESASLSNVESIESVNASLGNVLSRTNNVLLWCSYFARIT